MSGDALQAHADRFLAVATQHRECLGGRVTEVTDADASIGDDVTIGHGVVCHAKYIGDGALIGNGAVMNDGVEVGEGSLVAAGAVLPERVVIPAGSLVRGMPGRVLGPVRNRHLELMRGAAKSYVDRLGRYKEAGLQG